MVKPATGRLRALLQGDGIVVAPGVFDGLSAHLVRRAGFEAIYASGGAIARSMGYPDLGLIGMREMVGRLEQIVEAASAPVIADADTGYGGALSVWRTVGAYQRAGVAALHIEDQGFPKRCGHHAGKTLVGCAEMTAKIRAARDAADPDFVVIARTDAIAVEGFDRALERARAYKAAGADMLFVEAPVDQAQIEAIADALPGPLVINMFAGGRTPLTPIERLRALGYKLVIVPSDLQRASIKAMEAVLQIIRRDGDSASGRDLLAPIERRDEVVGLDDYLRRADRFGDG